ncbi:MAG: hypothetical protein WBL70_20370 [Candidatus Acidiferrales bacterium]
MTLFLLRPILYFQFLLLLLAAFPVSSAYAQETVFDVPSADILDKGKVYGELDGTVNVPDTLATFTPRVVVGIGHGIEIGMNFDGLSAPTSGQFEISPALKWQLWKAGTSGWSFFVGDDLFFPVHQRTYDAGNYAYATFAKQWQQGTRITFGAYDFTRDVVATGNRAGGEFTFEQPIDKRLTLAAEWYTGNSSVGYVNPGAIIKLSSQFTLYAAYQIGNSGLTKGNHQFLWELGYNFN